MSWFFAAPTPDPQCEALRASLGAILTQLFTAERVATLRAETGEDAAERPSADLVQTNAELAAAVERETLQQGNSRAAPMRELLSKLVAQLGELELLLPAVAARGPGGGTATEALLEASVARAVGAVRAIYAAKCPEKSAADVDATIARYAGEEEVLLAKVRAKYGVPCAAAAKTAAPTPTEEDAHEDATADDDDGDEASTDEMAEEGEGSTEEGSVEEEEGSVEEVGLLGYPTEMMRCERSTASLSPVQSEGSNEGGSRGGSRAGTPPPPATLPATLMPGSVPGGATEQPRRRRPSKEVLDRAGRILPTTPEQSESPVRAQHLVRATAAPRSHARSAVGSCEEGSDVDEEADDAVDVGAVEEVEERSVAAASPGSPCTPGRVASLMAAREGNPLVAAPATSPDAASRRRIANLRAGGYDFAGAMGTAGGGGGGCGGYVGTPRPGGSGGGGATKAGGAAWWDLCGCLEKCAPKS